LLTNFHFLFVARKIAIYGYGEASSCHFPVGSAAAEAATPAAAA